MNDYILTDTIIHKLVVKSDYDPITNRYAYTKVLHNQELVTVLDYISNLTCEGMDVRYSIDCLDRYNREVIVYICD